MNGSQGENENQGGEGMEVIHFKKQRNAYVTGPQKQQLNAYVQRNYGVLYGNAPYEVGQQTKDEFWTLLAMKLNAMGPTKSVTGWKRCYTSLKSSAKRKLQVVTSNSDTGTYSTPHQRQQLVDLVSQNYDALFGKLSNSSNGGLIKKKVWKLIADKLNSLGPKKDVDGWIRCFSGLKSSTKGKLTVIRQNKNRRNQRSEPGGLNAIQCEMLNMHDPDVLDGSQNLDELGIGRHTVSSVKFSSSKLGATASTEQGSSDNDMDVFTPATEQDITLNAQVTNLNDGIDELDRQVFALRKKFEHSKNLQTSTIVSGDLVTHPEHTYVEISNEDNVDPDFVYWNDASTMDLAFDLTQQTSTSIGIKHRQVQQANHLFGLSVGAGETNNEETDEATDNDCMERDAFQEGNVQTDMELEEQHYSHHRDVRQNECQSGGRNLTTLRTTSERATGPFQIISDVIVVPGASQRQSESLEVRDKPLLPSGTTEIPVYQKRPSQRKSIDTSTVSTATKRQIERPEVDHQSSKGPDTLRYQFGNIPVSTALKRQIERREVANQSSKDTNQIGDIPGIKNIVVTQEPESSQRQARVTTLHQLQRPQRRGVEINLDKYIEARRIVGLYEGEDDGNTTRRRNRLSVPLGVMATESLDEQKSTNNLLAQILRLLSNRENQ